MTVPPRTRAASCSAAVLRAPGEGTRLLRQRGIVPARYDVVVLTRTTDPAAALALRDDPAYQGLTINHASCPSMHAFLPSLIFRPTFPSFVLANFKANDIAAQPIIYRRVR